MNDDDTLKMMLIFGLASAALLGLLAVLAPMKHLGELAERADQTKVDTDKAKQSGDADVGDGDSADGPWAELGVGAGVLTLGGGLVLGAVRVRRTRRRRRTVVDDLHERWSRSAERHDRVREEYGAIMCDPLLALDHLGLWRVDDPVVVRWDEASAAALDTRSIHPYGSTEESVVARYARETHAAARTWKEALDQARSLGLDAVTGPDRTRARRARGLLLVAADDTATPAEQALATQRAHQLLEDLHSVCLPDQMRALLATKSRRELAMSNKPG